MKGIRMETGGMDFRIRAALLVSAAVLGLSACTDGPGIAAGDEETSALVAARAGALPPIVKLMEGSLDRTPFKGLRTMTSFVAVADHLGGPLQTLTAERIETRQTVAADGLGGFTIELDEEIALPVSIDSFSFPTSFERSVGAQWHAREFRVRDLERLVSNYSVSVMDLGHVVAGIPCHRVEFQRFTPFVERPGLYQLDVDPTTGFVLAMAELDALRNVIQEFQYESFEYAADLNDVALRREAFASTRFDVYQPLGRQAGFTVLVPDLLPDGFALSRASSFEVPVEIAPGESSFLVTGDWARLTADDGIEAIRFAHARPGVIQPIGAAPTEVRVLYEGSFGVLFGNVRGVPIVCLGRVGPNALRRMIESSF